MLSLITATWLIRSFCSEKKYDWQGKVSWCSEIVSEATSRKPIPQSDRNTENNNNCVVLQWGHLKKITQNSGSLPMDKCHKLR